MCHRFCTKIHIGKFPILLAAMVFMPFAGADTLNEPQSPANAYTLGSIDSETQMKDGFARWVEDFSIRAAEKGHNKAIIRTLMTDLEYLTIYVTHDTNQAEFQKPIWEYISTLASVERLAEGRRIFQAETKLLLDLENHYGVPAEILTAIWGVETNYGRLIGDFDAPEALANMAYHGRRRRLGENELISLIKILERGEAERGDLIAGWAGAMGQTQFIPSSYLSYAQDWDKDGKKDVWKNHADALASAAYFLKHMGWMSGQPWIMEVNLPEGFDYALANRKPRRIKTWHTLGVRGAVSNLDMHKDSFAALFVPAGASAPAFLTFHNFDVIKRYNRSDSYALVISLMANHFAGVPGLQKNWPADTAHIALKDIKHIQTILNKLGYDAGQPDGLTGPKTRNALRIFQKDRGMVADGFVTPELVALITSLGNDLSVQHSLEE